SVRAGADPLPALRRLDASLGELCRHGTRPLIGVNNVVESDLPLWRARGYRFARQRDFMVLDLPGRTYEQYLEALPTSDRRELRRVGRRGADFGVELSLEPLAGQGGELYPLLVEIFAHHGTPLAAMPFTPELFPAI